LGKLTNSQSNTTIKSYPKSKGKMVGGLRKRGNESKGKKTGQIATKKGGKKKKQKTFRQGKTG